MTFNLEEELKKEYGDAQGGVGVNGVKDSPAAMSESERMRLQNDEAAALWREKQRAERQRAIEAGELKEIGGNTYDVRTPDGRMRASQAQWDADKAAGAAVSRYRPGMTVGEMRAQDAAEERARWDEQFRRQHDGFSKTELNALGRDSFGTSTKEYKDGLARAIEQRKQRELELRLGEQEMAMQKARGDEALGLAGVRANAQVDAAGLRSGAQIEAANARALAQERAARLNAESRMGELEKKLAAGRETQQSAQAFKAGEAEKDRASKEGIAKQKMENDRFMAELKNASAEKRASMYSETKKEIAAKEKAGKDARAEKERLAGAIKAMVGATLGVDTLAKVKQLFPGITDEEIQAIYGQK